MDGSLDLPESSPGACILGRGIYCFDKIIGVEFASFDGMPYHCGVINSYCLIIFVCARTKLFAFR